MSGPHFEERGICGVCGRGTTNGSCICVTYAWPRYSPLVLDLEEPEDESCPQCAEPLRIAGYCGACGWRGSE